MKGYRHDILWQSGLDRSTSQRKGIEGGEYSIKRPAGNKLVLRGYTLSVQDKICTCTSWESLG